MTDREARAVQAVNRFEEAFQRQMAGELEEAVRLYKESIALEPSAEAHTFLGWTYSFQGRYKEAIAECRKAIALDPDFGNPYNDIGVYLIELNRPHEAIGWLKKATRAPRYESPCFPWFNLGRIHEARAEWQQARECYEKSLQANPEYTLARHAIERVGAWLN